MTNTAETTPANTTQEVDSTTTHPAQVPGSPSEIAEKTVSFKEHNDLKAVKGRLETEVEQLRKFKQETLQNEMTTNELNTELQKQVQAEQANSLSWKQKFEALEKKVNDDFTAKENAAETVLNQKIKELEGHVDKDKFISAIEHAQTNQAKLGVLTNMMAMSVTTNAASKSFSPENGDKPKYNDFNTLMSDFEKGKNMI